MTFTVCCLFFGPVSTYTTQRYGVRWLVNDELEGIWKEVAVAYTGTILALTWRDWRKPWNFSVMLEFFLGFSWLPSGPPAKCHNIISITSELPSLYNLSFTNHPTIRWCPRYVVKYATTFTATPTCSVRTSEVTNISITHWCADYGAIYQRWQLYPWSAQ
jgi:hypothetical protein